MFDVRSVTTFRLDSMAISIVEESADHVGVGTSVVLVTVSITDMKGSVHAKNCILKCIHNPTFENSGTWQLHTVLTRHGFKPKHSSAIRNIDSQRMIHS